MTTNEFFAAVLGFMVGVSACVTARSFEKPPTPSAKQEAIDRLLKEAGEANDRAEAVLLRMWAVESKRCAYIPGHCYAQRGLGPLQEVSCETTDAIRANEGICR